MAIDAETQRLMLNWAAWRCGSIGSVATSGAYSLEGRGRHEETSIPLINGEAVEVDQAVSDLAPDLKLAVEEYWTRTGVIADKAKRCSCTTMTLYRRLDRAHAAINSFRQQQRARLKPAASLAFLKPAAIAIKKA